MKTVFITLTPLQALKLLAENNGSVEGLYFRDRENLEWTKFTLVGISVRGEFAFKGCDATGGGCWFRECAKVEKLNPVASGYNPKGLKESEVGVSEGWRLLTEEELWLRDHQRDDGIEFRYGAINRWETEFSRIGGSPCWTFRTKKPAGFYLPKPDVFKPWSLETAPKGCVLLREKAGTKYPSTTLCLVNEWTDRGLAYGTRFSLTYADLLAAKEHSLDGKTWSPCGLKEAAQ